MGNLNNLEKGKSNAVLSKKMKFDTAAKSDLLKAMSSEFGGREFDNHDITQVQKSLQAEGKNSNDPEILKKDFREYAHKTGGSAGGKVGDGHMNMAA